MQPPIRIKLYGLFSITKRGYLTQLAVALVLIGLLLVVWTYLPSVDELKGSSPELDQARRVLGWLRYLPWFVLGFVVLYAIEAFLVLRRFAREEARRRTEVVESMPRP